MTMCCSFMLISREINCVSECDETTQMIFLVEGPFPLRLSHIHEKKMKQGNETPRNTLKQYEITMKHFETV